MPANMTETRKHDTVILGVLVALGVIAALALGEFAFQHWLGPGSDESGTIASSRTSSSGSYAPAPAGPPFAPSESVATPSPSPALPQLKAPGCKPNDSRCLGQNTASGARKPPPNRVASSNTTSTSSPSQDSPPEPTPYQAPNTPEEARAAEQQLRAVEDRTAHLVALEREEIERLTERANSANGRADALSRSQPSQSQQKQEDLAFAQQRLQSYLKQAESALSNADVQTAQKFANLAKTELEKLEKLLARS